jgi:type I restriction enzyme M protein
MMSKATVQDSLHATCKPSGLNCLGHVPHAWINDDKKCRDEKDNGIGIVGYEINVNRYEPPRPLKEIDADIKALEAEILQMLGEVTR